MSANYEILSDAGLTSTMNYYIAMEEELLKQAASFHEEQEKIMAVMAERTIAVVEGSTK
jgi:hypothetical protein